MWGKLAVLGLCAPVAALAASCPGGGLSAHNRCWYLGEAGASCSATCKAHSLDFSWFVVGEDAPMVPKLLGRAPGTQQFAWGRLECYVAQGDRFHTAKDVSSTNTGDSGSAGDWKVDGVCRLACPCAEPAGAMPAAAAAPGGPYPSCVEQNTVMRHAGAHAIFQDLNAHGSATGCWQNDCKNSDKFNAQDSGICARACAEVEECTHWSFGEQDGEKKCFFRKSDGGREAADGWLSAAKGCAPAALPSSTMALAAAKVLLPCDAGKSDACPDIAKAVTTWKFAISHLQKATEGKVDANTMQFINQVQADTDAFAVQMSEENFPVIVGNNRQVIQVLQGWLDSQPVANVDPNDASLPNPLRGKLCGPTSCFDM